MSESIRTNGSLMGNILGTAEIDIQIGQTVAPVRAIFADLPIPGILGMDFLLPSRGMLDFRTFELHLNGERIRCTDRIGSSFCYRVVVESTTTAGHEAMVPGHIRTKSEDIAQLGIIEPVESGGELAKRGLV